MTENERIGALAAGLFPGARVIEVGALDGGSIKATGYGAPRRVRLATPEGERALVFHLQRADGFGHDRRADRAGAQILAWDTFGRIPRHARALDVGAIGDDGRLVSLRGAGEFYLVTAWVPGTPYADDLLRIARTGTVEPRDLARVTALARYLVELHARRLPPDAHRWCRVLRDLVGDGEGIFGMSDGYPPDTPGAPPARLQAIEQRCLDWRWRLRDRAHRLTTTHGDFHPFNVVFSDEDAAFTCLDASRGCAGDAADDVTAMAINFVFFAIDAKNDSGWSALGALWRRFWSVYLDGTGDHALLDVAAPWLAWRALVVASPAFYPHLSGAARDRLLGWIEHVLDAPRLALDSADAVFTKVFR